jgi:hypothetical protein
MKHKARTKVRVKLMKAVTKYVPIHEPTKYGFNEATQDTNLNQQGNKTNVTTNKLLKTLLSLSPDHFTQWDTTRGFINQNYPEGGVLVQCMNAIRSPNRDTRKTKRILKLLSIPKNVKATSSNSRHLRCIHGAWCG